MKHKWHKEIKAWADGAEVEFQYPDQDNKWLLDNDPQWNDRDYVFRIKPQPKQPKYLYAISKTNAGNRGVWLSKDDLLLSDEYIIGKIEVQDD